MVALATVFGVWVRRAQAGGEGRALWPNTDVVPAELEEGLKWNQIIIKIITLEGFIVDIIALRDIFKFSCLYPNIRAVTLNDLYGGDFKIMIDFSQVTSLSKSAWEFPLLLCGVCNVHSSASLRSPWYFESDHNGCCTSAALLNGYKSVKLESGRKPPEPNSSF